MPTIAIRPLRASPEISAALSEILIETVAGGGSVTFMHPLDPAIARAFWDDSLAAAARGERIVLGAWDGEALACPPNQPHRAEIAKLMIRPSHRRRGIAATLIRAAEENAAARARTLLTLDTAAEEGAAALYEKLGFTLAGTIPDYAFRPHGGLTGAMFYWKRIGAGKSV
jgi:ribosomal protein S18 acetylase RimI-like enzyme